MTCNLSGRTSKRRSMSALGLAGDGNHRISHLDRGFLKPARKVIASAQLLAFPRSQRLERMHRNRPAECRNSASREYRPNGHTRCGNAPGPPLNSTVLKSRERWSAPKTDLQRLWARIGIRIQAEAERGKIARSDILIAEATHVDRHELGELAAQILHVNTSPPIDVRGEFVCEEEYIHIPRIQVRLPSVGRTAAHG